MIRIWPYSPKNGNIVLLFSYKFNEIIPFDKWKTTVLTKIKARIPEEPGHEATGETKNEGYSAKGHVEDDD